MRNAVTFEIKSGTTNGMCVISLLMGVKVKNGLGRAVLEPQSRRLAENSRDGGTREQALLCATLWTAMSS